MVFTRSQRTKRRGNPPPPTMSPDKGGSSLSAPPPPLLTGLFPAKFGEANSPRQWWKRSERVWAPSSVGSQLDRDSLVHFTSGDKTDFFLFSPVICSLHTSESGHILPKLAILAKDEGTLWPRTADDIGSLLHTAARVIRKQHN